MMRRKLQLLGCVAVTAALLSGCWGQVGYDPGHSRFNVDESTLTAANVGTLQQQWSVELLQQASEPMVRSGRVFLTTWTPNTKVDVRSILIPNGETEWNRRLVDFSANAFHATPATFVGGELWAGYLGVGDVGGHPVGGYEAPLRLDPSDGSTIGADRQIVASPAIDAAGSVVQNWFEIGVGQVVSVRDAGSLATTWQVTIPRQIISAPPDPYPMAVADGRLFVVDHEGRLHMFPLAGCGAATCTPAWSRDLGIAARRNQPLAIGSQVFVVEGIPGNPDAGTTTLVALDGATGTPNWSSGVANTGTFVDTDLAATPDTIYAAAGYTGAAKLSAFAVDEACEPGTSGCLVWHADLPSAPTASPVVAGQVVYVGVQHAVLAFAAEGCRTPPCTPIATFPVNGTPEHVVVAAGKLFVVHSAGFGQPSYLTSFAPTA